MHQSHLTVRQSHVTLSDCAVDGGFSLEQAELAGALLIDGLEVDKGVSLTGTLITGRCDVFNITTPSIINADAMILSSYMGWSGLKASEFSFNSCQVTVPFADESGSFLTWTEVSSVSVCGSTFSSRTPIGLDREGKNRRASTDRAWLSLEGSQFEKGLSFTGLILNYGGAYRFAHDESERRSAEAVGFLPINKGGEQSLQLPTVDMHGVRVGGYLDMPSRAMVPGGLNLTDADIHAIRFQLPEGSEDISSVIDDAARVTMTKRWMVGAIVVNRWAQGDFPLIQQGDNHAAFRALRAWLPAGLSTEVFHLNPWVSVANALATEGFEKEATDLRIRAYDQYLKSRGGFWRQVWRAISRVTIGHGYRPSLALWGILIVYLLAVLVVLVGADTFVTADGSVTKPGLWSFLYGLDVVVPAIGSGQSSMWVTTSWWMAALLWWLKMVSTGLVALFVSGLAGWTNRAANRD